MKISTLIVMGGITLLMSSSIFASIHKSNDTAPIQIAWWGEKDKTWCERHPKRCERMHHREKMKHERHERWCQKHPKKCERQHQAQLEKHQRFCKRHPDQCK